MNLERLQYQGLLTQNKKKITQCKLEAAGIMITLRTQLNPYEDDLTLLNLEAAKVLLERLLELQCQLKELSQKVRSLQEALGEED